MRIFLLIFTFIVFAVVSILGFRGSLSKNTPIEVFPDMDRQAKYKPQAENGFFEDGRNDRPLPAQTIARGNYLNQQAVFSPEFADSKLGDMAYNLGKNPDGSFVKKIPIEATNELMKIGEERYSIFCAACHGAAGDGNGVTKPYGVLAATYHDNRLRSVEDGYIFDVITNGKGLMYGLKDRLSPRERWAAILYVRALQQSQNASVEVLNPAQRIELGF